MIKAAMTFKRQLRVLTIAMGIIGGMFLFMGVNTVGVPRPLSDGVAIAFGGLLAVGLYQFGVWVNSRT